MQPLCILSSVVLSKSTSTSMRSSPIVLTKHSARQPRSTVSWTAEMFRRICRKKRAISRRSDHHQGSHIDCWLVFGCFRPTAAPNRQSIPSRMLFLIGSAHFCWLQWSACLYSYRPHAPYLCTQLQPTRYTLLERQPANSQQIDLGITDDWMIVMIVMTDDIRHNHQRITTFVIGYHYYPVITTTIGTSIKFAGVSVYLSVQQQAE